ncbi:MAG: VCBS repeat-containing protein [Anaerolineales bacterium]|nr:VCBS repeat-containing protein [Anaerolineales bacterium]
MNQKWVRLCCVCSFVLLATALNLGQRPFATADTTLTQAFPYQAGFPRLEPRNSISFGSPAVVDLDGNGRLDLLSADGSGCVWAWDETGRLLPGFPLQTGGACSGTPRISGPLAVGDVDGDGRLEIAAGTRGTGEAPGTRGRIFLWHADGTLVPGWPQEMAWNTQFGSGLPEVNSVAMANVAGNGRLEIIAGTSNNSSDGGDPEVDPTHNLYAFRADGSTLPGFPTQYRRAGIWGFVGAADLDGDGYAEVLAGRDHYYAFAYSPQGTPMPGWPVEGLVDPDDTRGLIMEFTRDAPAMADLDNDGQIEIVIPGKVRDRRQNREITNSAVLVLLPDGRRKPGWEVAKLGGAPLYDEYPPTQAPALADLTGDGRLELVVPMLDGKIRAFEADGTLLWTYDLAAGARLFATEPVIGDVTGDGRPDVLFGAYSPDHSANQRMGVYALDRHGNLLPGFPLPLTHEAGATRHGLRAAPTLTDLDNDCDVEIVAGSRGGVVYVWDLPAPYDPAHMPWPTARHDFQRTGFVETAVGPWGMETAVDLTQHAFLPLLRSPGGYQCSP